GDDVQEPATEEVATNVIPPTPTSPSPPSPIIPSSPPHQPPCPPQPQDAEGLEHDKAAQQMAVIKLKSRVKKLERINKVKSSKLRRLKKVGTSQRVESLDDVENVFNQGRMIVDMDQDEGIELVADQEKNAKKDVEVDGRHENKQAEIYNINLDHSSKVLSMQEDDTEVAAASTPIPAAKPKTLTITAAPAVSTRRRKRVVIRDPKDDLSSDTLAETPKEEINKEHEESYKNIDWNAVLDHVQSKETQYIKRYHGMKKKPQTESEARKNMILYLRNTKGYKMEFFKGLKYDEILPIFQAKFDANMRFLFKTREEMELEVVVNEDDDVFIEATPIGRKVPVVNYEIVMINKKPRYKIIRADDTHQLYTSFITLLKNFDKEDLKDLLRIVKARFSTSKPTNFSDDYLLSTLKTMFEKIDGQDALWRNQQSVYGQALVKS
nr:hypothetical protein [Tanacetum cinerariifolium]